jgi:excisionase family DNA binding protein
MGHSLSMAFLFLKQGGFFMVRNLKSIKEMAEILNCKPSWLYSRTRTNEIPFYRLGKYVRFDEIEVMEWLKEQQKNSDQ